MRKPRVLDLFCCAGGAAMGYHMAGFEVVGVDINPQPNYPFTFIQADVMTEFEPSDAEDFDLLHASPPCEGYSATEVLWGNSERYPMLISDVRAMFEETGKPYVIENVERAAWDMKNPIVLCGEFFGIRTYRHRLFECSWPARQPNHPLHRAWTAKMGRPVGDDEYMIIAGHFTGVDLAREIMEMPWATRDELAQAIPPAYAKYIGESFLDNRLTRQ